MRNSPKKLIFLQPQPRFSAEIRSASRERPYLLHCQSTAEPQTPCWSVVTFSLSWKNALLLPVTEFRVFRASLYFFYKQSANLSHYFLSSQEWGSKMVTRDKVTMPVLKVTCFAFENASGKRQANAKKWKDTPFLIERELSEADIAVLCTSS